MNLADILSQMPGADYAALVPQLGFGGALLWIVTNWLRDIRIFIVARLETMDRASSDRHEMLNHTLRGLSKLIAMDLASRPYSEEITKSEAKRMLIRIETREKLEEDLRRARAGEKPAGV